MCNLIFLGDDEPVSMLYQEKVYVQRVAISGNYLSGYRSFHCILMS